MCAPVSSPAITAPPWLGEQVPLPVPSPLVTPARRMVLRPATSSSPWVPRNLRLFGSPPAATPPLLLRPPHCPAASLPPRCLLIQRACLFPEIQLEVGNRASALASPRGGPASESGWSFPMLGALTHRVRAVNDGGNQKRKSSPLLVQTPLTMFVQQENTQQLSSPPPRLSLQPAPRCWCSSSFRSAPSWTDRCGFHQRGNGAAQPGRTGCQTPLH